MKTEVLNFWFNEIDQKQWWVKHSDFDQLIHERFSDIHASANACELYKWRETPEGRLAEIIVLDQFSRNVFRDTPKAFASDTLALAQEAIAVGDDMRLNELQKIFLYMPFMHSESLKCAIPLRYVNLSAWSSNEIIYINLVGFAHRYN